MTSMSSSIQPHRAHTIEDMRLAITKAPGIELLSLLLRTVGIVTSIEAAAMKLENDDMRPVKKSARSAGSTNIAQTCKNTNVTAALKYLCKLSKNGPWRQFL